MYRSFFIIFTILTIAVTACGPSARLVFAPRHSGDRMTLEAGAEQATAWSVECRRLESRSTHVGLGVLGGALLSGAATIVGLVSGDDAWLWTGALGSGAVASAEVTARVLDAQRRQLCAVHPLVRRPASGPAKTADQPALF